MVTSVLHHQSEGDHGLSSEPNELHFDTEDHILSSFQDVASDDEARDDEMTQDEYTVEQVSDALMADIVECDGDHSAAGKGTTNGSGAPLEASTSIHLSPQLENLHMAHNPSNESAIPAEMNVANVTDETMILPEVASTELQAPEQDAADSCIDMSMLNALDTIDDVMADKAEFVDNQDGFQMTRHLEAATGLMTGVVSVDDASKAAEDASMESLATNQRASANLLPWPTDGIIYSKPVVEAEIAGQLQVQLMSTLRRVQDEIIDQANSIDGTTTTNKKDSRNTKRKSTDTGTEQNTKRLKTEQKLWEQDFEEIDEDGREAAVEFKKQAKRINRKQPFTDMDDFLLRRLIVEEIKRRQMVDDSREVEEELEVEDMNEVGDQTEEPSLFVTANNFPDFQPISKKRQKSRKDKSTGKTLNLPNAGEESENEQDKQPEGDKQNEAHTGIRHLTSTQSTPGPRKSKQQQLALASMLEHAKVVAAKEHRKRGPQTNPTQKPRNPHQRKKRSSKGTPGMPQLQSGPGLQSLNSLSAGNVFKDATALREGEKDAGRLAIGYGNKREALKNMIAALPAERRDESTYDLRALEKASKKFSGTGLCRLEGASWKLKGMKSTLRHFQMTGAAWMREREASNSVKGGIVADAMGMGKTITMLANIVNGHPKSNYRGAARATLIVTPSSLLKQWFDEIQKHVDIAALPGMVIKYYHGGKGIQTADPMSMYKNASIVLTTYHEITKSCQKIQFPKDLTTQQQKEQWLQDNRANFRGLFHQIEWYRVVVDEAHCMKNHLSLTSLAMRELMAKYRWAITGTPIHNSPRELYPYFKFLQMPNTGNCKVFAHNYDNGSQTGRDRLLVHLNMMMLRRTYKDEMLNEPLVKLPQTQKTDHCIALNATEASVYRIMQQRIIERINAGSVDGERNYANHFTYLLRLRQLTSHILLVEESMRDLLTEDDIKEIRDIAYLKNASDELNMNTIRDLRKLIEAHEQKVGHQGQHLPFEHRNLDGVGNAFGICHDFQAMLEKLRENGQYEEVQQKMQCNKCSQNPAIHPHITTCNHVYCGGCWSQMSMAANLGFDTSRHPLCLAPGCGLAVQAVEYKETPKRPKKNGSPGSDESSKEQKHKPLYMEDGNLLPSSKTLAVKAQIMNWIEREPKTKIIVFTQFIPMIHILTRMCEMEGWASLAFHGGITMDERDLVISQFAKAEGPCIFLSSLRCGGVGLNLTMASKVISIDPWWNWAMEMQAFGRVFRIGQEEKTYMSRFFAVNTVDMAIFQMQEKKQERIDKVMDPDEAVRQQKLSHKDLLSLFGEVSENTDGNFVVAPDTNHSPIFDDNAYQLWEDDGTGKKKRRAGAAVEGRD